MTALYRLPTSASRVRRRRRIGAALAAVAAVAAGAALLLPARAGALESVMFNMSGRGWGHGVGMSQWGAYGYAKHGWTYRQILSHYYTGITYGRVANSTIRVLLNQSQKVVRVSAATLYHAKWGAYQLSIAGGATAAVSWSGGAYSLVAGGRTYRSTTPILFTPGTSRLLLSNATTVGASTAKRHYRGNLRVIHTSAGLSIVNVLRTEDYLRGVVPREVPASWPAAVLRAQAAAARSYAASHLASSGIFDVYCDTRSQAYGGADGEATATNAAIDATRGIVPLYGGKPIRAFFFSTSGGHTESVQNVWGGVIPYLIGVSDPYDTYSPYHVWRENPIRRTGALVQAELGTTYAPPGTTQTIYVVKRGVSPRIVTAYAIGTGGVKPLSGSVLRARLGLRDTWFSVRTLSVNPGPSPRTTITYGAAFSVAGRVFPRLATTEQLILHYRQGSGAWRTQVVPAQDLTAGTVALTSTLTAAYTAYAVPIRPAALSSYYFTVGSSTSPQTSIAVRPAVTLTPPDANPLTGQQASFAATVAPASLAGTTVGLQELMGGVWTTVGSGKLDETGACGITWTAGVPGTHSFRLSVPAVGGLSAAAGSVVQVSVDAPPSPAPATSLVPSRF